MCLRNDNTLAAFVKYSQQRSDMQPLKIYLERLSNPLTESESSELVRISAPDSQSSAIIFKQDEESVFSPSQINEPAVSVAEPDVFAYVPSPKIRFFGHLFDSKISIIPFQ